VTIANTSEIRRIPRLGKVRLGIKTQSPQSGKEYPRAVDYFVVPEEVAKIYGEKPKELDILFPLEDDEQFAPQFLRAYSKTQGLVCIGDGNSCRRKVDTKTGAMASHETQLWEWKETICNPQDCPEYQRKYCRRVMNLLFLLPKVPGLGCWQIDTSSFHSIVNINSMLSLLRGILGRCAMVPLTLTLQPMEVSPQGEKKKTVHVLTLRNNLALAELAQRAQLPPVRALLPEVTDETPEDLYLSDEPDIEQGVEHGVEQGKQTTSKPRGQKADKGQPATPPATPPPPPAEPLSNVVELRGELLAKASEVDAGYYSTVIEPRIKVAFQLEPEQLDEKQLAEAILWITGVPTKDERIAWLEQMKGFGLEKDAALAKLKDLTGKDRDRDKGELAKCILVTKKEAEQPTSTEAEKFLEEQDELFS